MRRKSETYIPSKPCKHGHFERYISTKKCVECNILWCKKNHQEHKKHNKKTRELYYKENREDILKKMKVASKKWYGENREDILIRNKARRRLNPERAICWFVKARAKKKGLEFNLVESDIVIPKYCPVFPEIELHISEGLASDNSPSLDRVDNSKGYVKGNVKIISNRANSLKSNGTVDEFKRLIEYIESSSQEKI